MAKNNDYTKYAQHADYEPQSLYLDSGSAMRIFGELRKLGTRRILLLCRPAVRKYKVVEDLVLALEKDGFRVFDFSRDHNTLIPEDIYAGLKVYKEFNCDSIITIGGASDVDCGKFISALAVNQVKSISEFEGVDKIRKDISVLCCIMTDSCCEVSSSFAEYYDNEQGRWIVSMSSYLIPQIVVNDTDISMRTDMEATIDSALNSLAMALEAFVDHRAVLSPTYKANAINASLGILSNISKIKNDPNDSFLRRQAATGAIYAGLASRTTGIGYAHMMVHALLSEYDVKKSGVVYLFFLSELMLRNIDRYASDLASLSKAMHLCTRSSDDLSAAQTFVDHLKMICGRNGINEIVFDTDEKTADKLCDIVRRDAQNYDLPKINTSDLKEIFNNVLKGE